MPLTVEELQYLVAVDAGDDARADQLAALIDAPCIDRATRLEHPGAIAAAAGWYAEQSVPVFPLHDAGPGWRCSCQRADCASPAKHPRSPEGFKDATTDPATVRAWWDRWPRANIGVPTGPRPGGAGFDVIDVDGRRGIDSILPTDPTACGLDCAIFPALLARTTTSRPGGHHLLIPATGRGNATNVLPGVDYRGAGGYIVVPPSLGANGRRYSWLRPLDPAVLR